MRVSDNLSVLLDSVTDEISTTNKPFYSDFGSFRRFMFARYVLNVVIWP